MTGRAERAARLGRRAFLSALGSGALLAGASACSARPSVPTAPPTPQQASPPAPSPTAPTPTPTPSALSPAPVLDRVPLPPPGQGIYSLPITSNHVAWTVDDGGDSNVIRKYAEMARDTGTRLTFFPNGQYPGWAEHAELIRPLVESGHVQIGNHTFSHPDLRTLSDQQIVDELLHNEQVLVSLFGTVLKPFYRPPFGYRNDRTDAAAASIGYTAPVMWFGSLADSAPISEEQLVEFARQWFLPQHIVIGHANHPAVTNVFPRILECLHERGLQTVTLNDVFLPAGR